MNLESPFVLAVASNTCNGGKTELLTGGHWGKLSTSSRSEKT